MAVTASLVFAAPNRLRYLLTQDGAAGTTLNITTTGAATPDLRTDSVGGAIKNLARAVTDGWPVPASSVSIIPPATTTLNQAGARALWLSDLTGVVTTPIGGLLPRAECEITPRTSAALNTWLVDANVDGSGNPLLAITAAADAATAYLDVYVPNAIGA